MSEQARVLIQTSAEPRGLAMISTRAVIGVNALPVMVEVHLANGLPSFSTVGLPETAVKESKDRVRGAILNSGFEFPAKRITVNLAPADLPKTGGRFDLAIAVGILVASGQLPGANLEDYEMIGELALDGRLRKVSGVLPTALASGAADRQLIVPDENAHEASLADRTSALSADHLLSVCQHLVRQNELKACGRPPANLKSVPSYPDLSDVKGQQQAKRALEIAAAGGHSLLFIGPPGTGKSMLASRLPGILPELDNDEALASAAIQSVTKGQFDIADWKQRPCRSPHHSASSVALVGGGSYPKPGEISLAHNGILFLDEFTEFSRASLEQLREPLESGQIHIARANQSVEYPAKFLLVAACNPCKCGLLNDGTNRCQCSTASIENYRAKLSGPMLDRIDIHLHLSRVDMKTLQSKEQSGENSEEIKQRVTEVRAEQLAQRGTLNSQFTNKQIAEYCELDDELLKFLELVCERLNMSARAYHRILKLARTIADMDGKQTISKQHLSEAVSFRSLDRR